jgi:DNA-binding transcriptional LysR family regulator
MRLMPQLVQSFRLAYPHIELVIGMTDRLVDIVEEDCDLAIRISAAPTDKSTIWRKICEIPRHLVASTEFLERHPAPGSPHDLDHSACLSYSPGKEPEHWALTSGSAKQNMRAGSDIISNNGDFLLAMVEAHAGMAILPEFILEDSFRKGLITRVFPDWEATPLWLSLYYPPYEALPPLVATFTDFFEAYLADLEGFRF